MQQVLDRLQQGKNILLVTHKDADGDALGSIIALKKFLSLYNPDASVYTYIDSRYRRNLKYWVEKYDLATEFSLEVEDIDTLVSLDCGVRQRIVFPDGFDDKKVDISIDHHREEEFGEYNIVDSAKASVGIILYELFKSTDVILDADMAEGIYLSIYTDTGRFSFSNTDSYTLSCAAEVARVGDLDLHGFYTNLYDSVDYEELKTFGSVVSQTSKHCQGRVILGRIGSDVNLDSREFIDFIRRDEQAVLAVVLVDEGSRIKASFRSKGDVDASQLAAHFGGGGHQHAAACRINEGDLDQAQEKLLNYLEKVL